MTRNTQKTIGKVRPPRVQITYDVEDGGATKAMSLPFVVGVLADLAPTATGEPPKLREKSFIEIDADNFEKVMESLQPNISIAVPNRLSDAGGSGKMKVSLAFPNMDAFSPAGVAKAVPELAELLRVRARLNDLLAKLEGNDRLNDLLAEVVMDEGVKAIAMQEVKRLQASPANTSEQDGAVDTSSLN